MSSQSSTTVDDGVSLENQNDSVFSNHIYSGRRDSDLLQAFADGVEKHDIGTLYEDDEIFELDLNEVKEFNEDLYDTVLEAVEPCLYNLKLALSYVLDQEFDNLQVTVSGEVPDSHEVNIEDIRAEHTESLVKIKCKVTDYTDQFTFRRLLYFRCSNSSCNQITPKEQSWDASLNKPEQCSNNDCSSSSMDALLDYKNNVQINRQEAIIQDLHHTSERNNPSDILCELNGKLVGELDIGDEVDVYARVRTEKIEEKTSDILLQIVGIEQQNKDYSSIEISEADKERIQELSQSDHIFSRLKSSIAPHISGDYETARSALLFQLFGGVTRHVGDSRQRGEIHVGYVGDPGTGKSDLGDYAAQVAPNGIYAAADKGSDVGLTASVDHEDRFDSDSWTLSGGAVVRADGGICVIDELDKADKDVQKSLHEPLSEQKVTVHKVASGTLKARCSVLVIANPDGDRFNEYDPLDSQIDINPALWDRMDVIVPFHDRPSEEDEEKVDAILAQASESSIDYIQKELFRKYIAYEPVREIG